MKNGIVLRGDLIWTESPDRFRYIEGGYLSIEDGIIREVSSVEPREGNIIDYSGSLIVPGLSDLHLHAPQYAFAGLFMDDRDLEESDVVRALENFSCVCEETLEVLFNEYRNKGL